MSVRAAVADAYKPHIGRSMEMKTEDMLKVIDYTVKLKSGLMVKADNAYWMVEHIAHLNNLPLIRVVASYYKPSDRTPDGCVVIIDDLEGATSSSALLINLLNKSIPFVVCVKQENSDYTVDYLDPSIKNRLMIIG